MMRAIHECAASPRLKRKYYRCSGDDQVHHLIDFERCMKARSSNRQLLDFRQYVASAELMIRSGSSQEDGVETVESMQDLFGPDSPERTPLDTEIFDRDVGGDSAASASRLPPLPYGFPRLQLFHALDSPLREIVFHHYHASDSPLREIV